MNGQRLTKSRLKWLFPGDSRYFPGQRWINISLRTLHLVGLAGCGYAFLVPGAIGGWEPYFRITLITGLLLTALYTWSNGIFLIQLRGIAVLLKILLLLVILVLPDHKHVLFLTIIVISGFIAHAPGDVRYYSLYHRRRIESLQQEFRL